MSDLKAGDPTIKQVIDKTLHKLKAEPVETLTIMVPIALKKKLKIKAINSNSTLTKIIVHCIEEYVK